MSCQVFFQLDVLETVALEDAVDEVALVVADFEEDVSVWL